MLNVHRINNQLPGTAALVTSKLKENHVFYVAGCFCGTAESIGGGYEGVVFEQFARTIQYTVCLASTNNLTFWDVLTLKSRQKSTPEYVVRIGLCTLYTTELTKLGRGAIFGGKKIPEGLNFGICMGKTSKLRGADFFHHVDLLRFFRNSCFD